MKKLLTVLLLCGVATAHAATITQMGTDVTFTYDDSTLYGTGTVVGNSIFFSPTTFKAESLNASGAVTASATLNIDIDIKPESQSSFSITEFKLLELGDYRLVGNSSSVDASGRLQVTSNTTTCGWFACFDEVLFSAGPLTTVGALTSWSASTEIDLNDTVGWGIDDSVNVQIQNNLQAISTVVGESAMVQKKFQGQAVVLAINPQVMVPVPPAILLFGSALGLLGWIRRRA
ncbi:MAG: hypothetical protein L6Q83_13725 [Gammaproteobacteria bacterium]|nr:hypothetical protein [Gammaproteobacteria bacterium]